MKRILMTGLILVSGLGLFAQEKVEDVISKHLAAIGGADNWRKVNTVVMDATMNVMGNDVALKMIQANKIGQKQEISVAGMTGFIMNTPTTAWMYMPFQGQQKPEPMTADDIKATVDDLDIQGNLLDYQAKGHKVELLGTEEIEGTECYKLKVMRKTSGEQTLFIDKNSYLIMRSVTKRSAMGQEMDMSADFSEYKDVNGLKIPHSITQQIGTIIINSVKVNEPVAPETFADPKQ